MIFGWLFLALGAATVAVWWTAGPGTLDVIDTIARGGNGAFVHRSDIPFGTTGQQLDVWEAAGAAPARKPVLIFFYGGGWVKGSRQEYGWAARAYADRGFVVVVPDYRKVPQVKFPAFVEDGAAAVKWTHNHIAEFGGDPDRIAIAGHSAGSHTVAMLALDPQWTAKAGLAPNTIKAAVGLSGPYDFYPFTGRAVAAMGSWPNPQETQPLHYARADAPPMLLVTGTTDTTVRPKNARNLFAKMKAMGARVEEKEYAGQGHEDIVVALSVPYRGKAPVLDDSVAFLNAHLGKAASPAH